MKINGSDVTRDAFTFLLVLFFPSRLSGWWPSGLDPSPWLRGYSCGVCTWWWVRPLKIGCTCWTSCTVFIDVSPCSQKIWCRRQSLRDHNRRWDSLLSPSCHSWGEKGVDQCRADGGKKWQIKETVSVWQLDWSSSLRVRTAAHN